MIKNYICPIMIFVLFFLSGFELFTQNETPKIFLKENFIQTKNFPGISECKRYIVNIHSDYSCCISTKYVFQLWDVSGDKIIKKIVIIPDDPEDKDFSDEYKKEIITKIQSLLNKYHFKSLIKTEDFETIKLGKNELIFFKNEKENIKYLSNSFNLGKFKASYHCCANIDKNQPCELNPIVHEVWVSPDRSVIFFSYGVIHAADGCDIGPYYKILNIHKTEFENKSKY